MNEKFAGLVLVAGLYAYWGVRHLLFSLPEVRHRVHAGAALEDDRARIRRERAAGVCFIAVAMGILLSQMLSLF